ncbi:MAG TPA: lysine transporter LysE [Thermoplasmatales archaeon]|nr:lysine transporter LysE [Thermoplasmatales archaeon]
MDVLQFIITVILITASGALAPGPLFFATISYGAKSGAKSGLIFSIAHTLVEFTLVMLLAVGLLTISNEPVVKLTIGVIGGVALIVFGLFQIKSLFTPGIKNQVYKEPSHKHLFIVGSVFTALNPYFILWWLTVGSQLIIMALEVAAFFGVLFMYLCHVWMDYAWLTGIAYFAKRGSSIIGSKGYHVVVAVFGFILIYFGLSFLIDALKLI